MVRIFCEPELKGGDDTLTLTGENFHHVIQVLRLKKGDEISVCFRDDATEYRYGIEEINPDSALCRLYFLKPADTELPCRITILQGLPKADKMETVIQKSVELGASGIIPVVCSRSIVRLDSKKAGAKTARWAKIAEAAAGQSRRAFVPEVSEPLSFRDALKITSDIDVRLIPYELASDKGCDMEMTRSVIKNIRPGQSVAVLIGPEGGFSEEEVSRASEAGFVPVTLGRRILRTETAAMTVLSWLVLELEP